MPAPEDAAAAAAVRRVSQPGPLPVAGEGGSSAGSGAAGGPRQLGQLRRQVAELEEELAGRTRELERAQQALPLALLPALGRLQQQLAAALEGPRLQGAGAEAVADAQAALREVCEQLQGAELAGLPLQEAQQSLPFVYAPLRTCPRSPGASSAAATSSYALAGSASPPDAAASSERVPLMGGRAASSSAALSPAAAGARRLPAASPGALLMQDNELFDEQEAESAPSGGPPAGEEEEERRQAGGAARQLSSMGDALQQELRGYRSDVGALQQEVERREGALQESSRALQERLVQVGVCECVCVWRAGWRFAGARTLCSAFDAAGRRAGGQA
jgi:hypothetical protein